MELVKSAEIFANDDENIRFLCTRVLYRQDSKFYLGQYAGRKSSFESKSDISKLTAIQEIQSEFYCPTASNNYTKASDSQTEGVYIKRPNLLQFEGTSHLAKFMLIDLHACEMLRRHPHPNLARYLGYNPHDGRVAALCFSEYKESLMEKLNPKSLKKAEFICTAKAARLAASRKYLPRIEQALRHMHGLGLVHNDLNPANIMIDAYDNPVIIDLDSCLEVGLPLSGIKRTMGSYDESIDVSRPENDWCALEEIRTWLEASTVERFSFWY